MTTKHLKLKPAKDKETRECYVTIVRDGLNHVDIAVGARTKKALIAAIERHWNYVPVDPKTIRYARFHKIR